MSLANKITLSRVLFIPIIIVVFFVNFPYHKLVTAIVFVIAAATDFVDGYIARKSKTVTTIGKFIDPIADKILVAVVLLLIIAGDFLYKPTILAVTLASVIITRELLIDGFRLIALSKGTVIAADKIGKAKTLTSVISLSLIISNIHIITTYVGWILLVIATVLTVISGISYIIKFRNIME